MFGYRLQKIWKQPPVAQIERTLSELADKYGYGDIWLYGNYYEGLYSELDDVQIMYDPSQNHRYMMGFMEEFYQASGLRVVTHRRDDGDPLAQYILANSRPVHMADENPCRMSDACRKNRQHSDGKHIRMSTEECLESISTLRRLLLGLKLEAFADYRPVEERCHVLLQLISDRICRLDDPQSSAEATEIARRLKGLATDDRGTGHFNTEADWMAAVDDIDRLERMCSEELNTDDPRV